MDLALSLDAVESTEFGVTAPSSTGGSAGLHAARIAFMKGPAHFNPRDWLSVFSAAVLVEPRLLRVGEPPDDDDERLPSSLQAAVKDLLDKKMAAAPAALPQGGARTEVLALLRDWAAHGRLRLAPAVGPDLAGATSRVFAVPKSVSEDRLVVDRQIENSKELALSGAARDLPSGSDMAEHCAPKGWSVRMSSEDLTDYFPSIDSSDSRAQTNGLDFLLTKAEARSLLAAGAAASPAGFDPEGGDETRKKVCSAAGLEGRMGHGPLPLGFCGQGGAGFGPRPRS